MTLSQQFEHALHAATTPHPIAVDVPPRRLECVPTEITSLAVNIDSLTLASSELANVSLKELERLSDDLSSRVNYLLEPIGPIELDADTCTVQMRSNPPHKDDDGRNYYELLAKRGGELSLKRYRKEPGQPRRAIAATLTREVLVRLVGDFCAVLDSLP